MLHREIMGTITARKRKDGSSAYLAQIRIKVAGKVVHTESQTFDRQPAASAWLKLRERELAQPDGMSKARSGDPFLSDVIDRYIKESRRNYGKTKKQVLATIKAAPIGKLRCSEIGSPELITFAESIGGHPSTAGNYMSHLASVFAIAKPAWGYPLDRQAMDDARTVADRLGVIGRSSRRDKRPSIEELDKLMAYFALYEAKNAPKAYPMRHLIGFGIFSTRRQEEITLLQWDDLDEAKSTIIVRNMKHPGEKIGNDVRVDIPPEAMAIIRLQPRTGQFIFPYQSKTISSYFTRACKVLGIIDIRFHDLRHDGISRLFELGKTIPQAACVSGHRSWVSLRRYTHIEQAGDKYAEWPWIKELCQQAQQIDQSMRGGKSKSSDRPASRS